MLQTSVEVQAEVQAVDEDEVKKNRGGRDSQDVGSTQGRQLKEVSPQGGGGRSRSLIGLVVRHSLSRRAISTFPVKLQLLKGGVTSLKAAKLLSKLVFFSFQASSKHFGLSEFMIKGCSFSILKMD